MVVKSWHALRAQFRRFGVRLMVLYLGLLLIPVLGMGLFGNFYMQRSVESYRQQYHQDVVALQASLIDRMVRNVQDDILYLEQRIQREADTKLSQFASAHAIYQQVRLMETLPGLTANTPTADPALTWMRTNPQLVSDMEIHEVVFAVTEATSQPLLLGLARVEQGILLLSLDVAEVLGEIDTPMVDAQLALLLPSGQALVTGDLSAPFPSFPGARGYVADADYAYFYQRAGPDGTWLLLRRLPLAAIHADLQAYYATFTILLVGSMVCVVGLALFAIARIIEPITQLKSMFDQLRGGETLPTAPSPVPQDDFGRLMVDFVDLAEELEEKRHSERNLIERLITAQEEERKLIAYDLHDGLIQQLVGARFYMRNCKSCELPVGRQDMLRGYDVLTQAITEGRRIIQGLHPTVLDDLGLVAALDELAETVTASAGWTLDKDLEAPDYAPHRVMSVTLYRIAQEALNNAFKHADATRVQVSLDCSTQHLTLTVSDDGSGFDPETLPAPRESGWGVRTMQERAQMLNGTCDITSSPDTGTTITVQIPRQYAVHPTTTGEITHV